jgi:phage-related tail protein
LKIINEFSQIEAALSNNDLDKISTNAINITKIAYDTNKKVKKMESQSVKAGHGHDETSHKLHVLLDNMTKSASTLHKGDVEKVREKVAHFSSLISDYVKFSGKPHSAKHNH